MKAILEAVELLDERSPARATASLRIGIIAPFLDRRATGLSSYIAEVVPRLCDAGHRVSVIATNCGYRGAEPGELIGIDPRATLRVFPVRGTLNRRLYRSAEMTKWLASAVREFDVVDLQGLWTFITVEAARACSAAGVPYVITPHGMMTRWDWSKKRNWKRVFYATLLRKVWQEAAAVRFLSEGERKNSMVAPTAPAAVIPNAVEVLAAADDARMAKREVCARLDLPANAKVILFLGRVTDQKGVVELLRAFAVMQARCPDAYLVIAGPLDGEYGSAVKKLASTNVRRVRVLGPVFGSEKNELFEAASLFVTLSKNEGLPIAVLEALSFGVPVVLTADSNLPEVEDFGAGTITTCDPERAASAISAMLLDPMRLGQMRVSAKRMIEQRFSWSFVLPQLEQLYQRAATEGGGTKTRRESQAKSMAFARVRKLSKILARGPYRRALRHGVAASTEHEALLRSLECRTIVDIGANRGQFALAVHTLIPAATIFSFEPLTEAARKFREVFNGNKQVRLHQMAIGPEPCTADIHVSGRDDSSSLLPITELQDEMHPGTAEAGVEKVQVERLADVLREEEIAAPALLKLDVQGYELETLRGCLKLLPRFTYVYAECSFVEFYRGQAFADQVIAFLRERGFALAGIYNLSHDKSGRALQGDFLFVNSSANGEGRP